MSATTATPPTTRTVRKAEVPRTLDTWVWLFMRWSGVLLIPLAWGHVLLQDVIVGVHRIELDYVAWRWSFVGWQIYDFALLGFAFAHGMNGLRYVMTDFVKNKQTQKVLSWLIFAAWLIVTAIGGLAILATRFKHEGLTFERLGEMVGFGITMDSSGTVSLAIALGLFAILVIGFIAFGRSKK
jgi:succinate dehydrogenase / fumarate reductase, membrane anchor subunit